MERDIGLSLARSSAKKTRRSLDSYRRSGDSRGAFYRPPGRSKQSAMLQPSEIYRPEGGATSRGAGTVAPRSIGIGSVSERSNA